LDQLKLLRGQSRGNPQRVWSLCGVGDHQPEQSTSTPYGADTVSLRQSVTSRPQVGSTPWMNFWKRFRERGLEEKQEVGTT
jgi:hypothetical protein